MGRLSLLLPRPRTALLLRALSYSIPFSSPAPSPRDPTVGPFPTPPEHYRRRRSEARTGEGCLAEAAISHPWPEWVELMERLLQKGYLDPDGFQRSSSCTHPKESNQVRTACLNFARDRFDLIRCLSQEDIQIISGFGCPSLDRKVVNSAKRLRAHVGIDEGNVCGSCKLRVNCERAYMAARKDEGARTVDVMRILLTHALDIMIGSAENHFYQNEKVKKSLRNLLREILRCSTKELDLRFQDAISESLSSVSEKSTRKQKQGDWICPKCDFLNFSRNIRCSRCDELSQEKLKKMREDREHLPLKRGDWICSMCNFLNFAKNTRCLQCNEKPVERQLGPGEWECVSCNFVNFRRNAMCLRCDWKRPKTSMAEPSFSYFQHDNNQECTDWYSRMRSQRNDNDSHQNLYFLSEDSLQSEETDFQSSAEDEFENQDSGTSLKFEDFPIKDGKSYISQDANERRRWKEEKMNKNRYKEASENRVTSNARRLLTHHGDLESANLRSLDLDEISDDDMSGWFGCKTKKMES